MKYIPLIVSFPVAWLGALAGDTPPPELGSPEALWKTIPVVAWYGIPAKFATPERYREMADAGFTMCVIPDGRPTTRTQLDCAAEAGIKIILQDQEMLANPDFAMTEFKDHPALGMYYLRDEPNAEYFPALRAAKDHIAETDSKHLSWINLYPNYATAEQMKTDDYATYVRRFLTEVKPPFLSFDHYGVISQGGRPALRSAYYQNLEFIARIAREFHLPFWAFVLTTAHGPYAVPTETELRFQIFNNLAYGARGIQYFTYWTPLQPDGDFVFHDGPILEDGTRTPLLDLIKKVNGEIKALTSALVGLKSVGVQHSKAGGPDVDKFSPGNGIKSISGEGDFLIGFFLDEDGNHWAFLVNQSFEFPGKVKVTATPGIVEVAEVSKKDGSIQKVDAESDSNNYVFTVGLDPGDGRLFKLTKTK